MSSSFTLVLDTRAPVVVFGAATGTTAGEFLRLPYVTDEPLAEATLRLSNGRVLDLAIGADELTVLLPPDAADGLATIRWRDDVGNADTALLYITGAIVEPPPVPPPSPIPPPRPKVPMRKRLSSRSTITARSTTTIRRGSAAQPQTIRRRERLTVVARTRIGVAPVRSRSAVVVTARSQRRAMQTSHTTLTALTSTRIRRRDDPDIEAILLDLL